MIEFQAKGEISKSELELHLVTRTVYIDLIRQDI